MKEPLTGSQLHVGGGGSHDITRKQQRRTKTHRRTGGGATVLLLDQSLVEGRRGWDGRRGGVQVLAVLAGTGPGGSHRCRWNKRDGRTSKSERLLPGGATPTEKLKHTSVLTRRVLWFGDRRDPFGLRRGDTDQC